MSEFEDMKTVFQNAKFGSYLVLPLKCAKHAPYKMRRYKYFQPISEENLLNECTDLSEYVKKTLTDSNVCMAYILPVECMKQWITGSDTCLHAMESENIQGSSAGNKFTLQESYLFIFHTGVAFLCLGIQYDNMSTLELMLAPGHAKNKTVYKFKSDDNTTFDLYKKLMSFYKKIGMIPFYETEDSCFLEAYAFTVSLVTMRFRNLDTIRQATFNLHTMQGPDEIFIDDSEQDLCYVYAKKDPKNADYGWGCCVTSQDISYIVANTKADYTIEEEMYTQAANGLPLIVLALYEKYTCLHFGELLKNKTTKTEEEISHLKKQMVEFQAFGTIAPANISRWHNVKCIYKKLLEVSEIPDAIDDIDNKLKVLSEYQEKHNEARNKALACVLTMFGIISIVTSVLTIFEYFIDLTSVSTSIIIAVTVLLIWLALRNIWRNWTRRE